jgi:hypothetical protein
LHNHRSLLLLHSYTMLSFTPPLHDPYCLFLFLFTRTTLPISSFVFFQFFLYFFFTSYF